MNVSDSLVRLFAATVIVTLLALTGSITAEETSSEEDGGWRVYDTNQGAIKIHSATGESFLLHSEKGNPVWIKIATRSAKSPESALAKVGITLKKAYKPHVYSGGRKDKPGLLVKTIQDDGIASKAGLRTGDVLISVNKTELYSIADWQTAVMDVNQATAKVVFLRRDTEYQPGPCEAPKYDKLEIDLLLTVDAD
ncbi:MAG: PDZ domain-containing protein [Planctomycetota bacterium]|jgi:predicted metalloprotease with PDZ domain